MTGPGSSSLSTKPLLCKAPEVLWDFDSYNVIYTIELYEIVDSQTNVEGIRYIRYNFFFQNW